MNRVAEHPVQFERIDEICAHFVRRRGAIPAGDWLEATLFELRPPLDRAIFAAAYSGIARRIRGDAGDVTAEEEKRFVAAGLGKPTGRPLVEIARTALLLRALDALASNEHPEFVERVYRRGDAPEQAALLRSLVVLPDPGRFLGTATDACRTNVLPVFRAIATGNPYPARHFPEPAFNQLVMKALFVEVPLDSIIDLPERITEELRRMAADYAQERRAAGRPVPDDVALLTREGTNP
jgi:hypothetical protein